MAFFTNNLCQRIFMDLCPKRLINLVLLRNVLINFQSYLILSLFKVYEAFMEFNFFSISVKVSTYNSQNNQCPLAFLLKSSNLGISLTRHVVSRQPTSFCVKQNSFRGSVKRFGGLRNKKLS